MRRLRYLLDKTNFNNVNELYYFSEYIATKHLLLKDMLQKGTE